MRQFNEEIDECCNLIEAYTVWVSCIAIKNIKYT
jgi:hypothetical protein